LPIVFELSSWQQGYKSLSALFVKQIRVKIFYSLLFNSFFNDCKKAPSLLLIFCLFTTVFPAVGEIIGELLFNFFWNYLLIFNDELYQSSHELITFRKALKLSKYAFLHGFYLTNIKCRIFELSFALFHQLQDNLRTFFLKIIELSHNLFHFLLLFFQFSSVSSLLF
jgi:hypothetical protein